VSADSVHPAEGVLGAAVLDVDQRLADLHGQVGRRRGGRLAAVPLQLPTGVTTAAVPQAKISVISPLATPSRHSSIENLRSSTWWPSLPASSMIEERVMPSRMVPVSGVTMRAVGEDEVHVHAAELLDVRPLLGVEEDHLVAALGVASCCATSELA
jgi:hypothetical protein